MTPAQDATALADCPFCGGKAERYDDHDTGSINEGGSCITCKVCQASSPMHFDRKENLVSSWNDRAENGVAPLATIADKAREWASYYPQSSDGRNTFILFAEWVEGLPTAALRATPQTPDAVREPQIYTAELLLNGKYTWCIVKALPRVETVIQEFGYGPDAYRTAETRLPEIKALYAHPQPQQADGRGAVIEALNMAKTYASSISDDWPEEMFAPTASDLGEALLVLAALYAHPQPDIGAGMARGHGGAPFDPTNHHNALKCPYCNPQGLEFAQPQQSAGPQAEALERCALIAEAIDSRRGNEKQIAKAIRELKEKGYWASAHPQPQQTESTPTKEDFAKWSRIWHDTCETIVTMLGLPGCGSPQELLAQVQSRVSAQPQQSDGRGKCGCGIMCQDLGKDAGCRYLKPERETLRKLVDIVYQHATESEAVPATLTADLLIDRAFAAVPLADGRGAVIEALKPFADIAPSVEYADRRDGEKVHEQYDRDLKRWLILTKEDFRRIARVYAALSQSPATDAAATRPSTWQEEH